MSKALTATLQTDAPGTFSASYTLNFSDEDLPGEAMSTLTLVLTGTVESALESADFDADGAVNGEDFLIWQRGLGVGTMLDGDANTDGVVDGTDLVVWRDQYGGASVAVVPEPSGVLLVMLTAAASGIIARRPRTG